MKTSTSPLHNQNRRKEQLDRITYRLRLPPEDERQSGRLFPVAFDHHWDEFHPPEGKGTAATVCSW
jgi:hypothetical protein